uniref:Ribosomal protein putative n=1 Tax=Albugo laibachii Nc14 TaxID=890382 RepID=F0W8Q7_9STRA|nr:ribosomal protein putative [Albugo laibachii Nc14]|eukprot:CCA17514.1 ribosomal protein putative [Albugo laibachii Nc14]
MRYIAAYLLAVLGGNESPSAANIEKILNSVGIEIDSERLEKVISELYGKSIDQIIAEGSKKLASFGGCGSAGPSAGGDAAASGAPAEEKVEVKEEAEEVDMAGGLSMFDDDDDY